MNFTIGLANSTVTSAGEPKPGVVSFCQTRQLGSDLFVCMENKPCPFALPYGYLTFCNNPSRNSAKAV